MPARNYVPIRRPWTFDEKFPSTKCPKFSRAFGRDYSTLGVGGGGIGTSVASASLLHAATLSIV